MKQSPSLRLQKIASELIATPTAKVFKDPNSSKFALDAASLFSLQGKVALVTGGTKGIGRMIAEGFMANGAKVYICSRKSDLCESVSKEINQKYSRTACFPLPGDLSTIEGVKEVAEALKTKENKLDILINNAGATWGSDFLSFPDAAWQKVMDLNVRAVFNLTQQLVPLLKAAQVRGDPSRVVIISSVAGLEPAQTAGKNAAFSYGVSKAGAIHLTKLLAKTFAERDYNITVNCVCPGLFPSNMTQHMLKVDGGETMSELNPMKRVGRTADMAATLLYFCGIGGGFTNGAILAMDGGARYVFNG
eukprot:augustus_masked-scaffold_12-processed-gene-12.76-mRNA-1 protein AED:0.03 eAED:0.03 QI:0/-1/0/1/-1/1/1/0/304